MHYKLELKLPVARENAAASRQIKASQRENAPVTHENAAPAVRRENSATMRENSATMHENNATARENSAMREGSAESDRVAATGNEFAPSASWNRFNEARGEARSAEFPAGSERGNAGHGYTRGRRLGAE